MKISLPTLLFVAFLVLKLCGIIAWSWWWVTAPLWGMAALWIIILLFSIAAIVCVALGVDAQARKQLKSVDRELRKYVR